MASPPSQSTLSRPIGFDQGEGLIALADRCEAATGPDRELNRDLEDAVGIVGDFTASLDAAMTLVPEGVSWSLYDVVGKREGVRMWCDDVDVLVAGATPALALCAAALRARAA